MDDKPKFTPGPWFDWAEREWLVEPSRLLTNFEDACLIAAAPCMAGYIKKRAAAGDAEAATLWEKLSGRA